MRIEEIVASVSERDALEEAAFVKELEEENAGLKSLFQEIRNRKFGERVDPEELENRRASVARG